MKFSIIAPHPFSGCHQEGVDYEVIVVEEALSEADAFNIGAKKARGDYLLFLRATDWLADKEVLRDVASHLDGVSWLYGQTEIIDEYGRNLVSFGYHPYKYWRLKRHYTISLSAVFISRELFFEVNGFRTDLKAMAGYEFLLRLAKCSDPLAIAYVVTKVQGQALSYHEKLERIDEAYRIRREHGNLFDRFFCKRTRKRQLQNICNAKHH